MPQGEPSTDTVIGTGNVNNSGVCTVEHTVTASELGVKKIRARYLENDTYMESVSEKQNYIISNPTTTTINNVIGNTGDSVTLRANVIANGNVSVSGGQVQFKVAGAIVGTSTVSAGVATYQYTVSVPNGSTIQAIYLGVPGTYGASYSNNATLGVRNNTILLAQNITANRGEQINIGFTATYNDGGTVKNVNKGTATVYLDGTSIGSCTVAAGEGSLTYNVGANATTGTHTIRIDYAENDTFEAETYTIQLNIRKPTVVAGVDISANRGQQVTLTANVTEDTVAAALVTEGYVQFSIDGGTGHNVAVSAGVATYPYTVPANYDGDLISVTAQFLQSANYEASDSTTFEITIREATTISVSPVTADIGETPSLVATVLDSNDSAVTTGNVEFIISNS